MIQGFLRRFFPRLKEDKNKNAQSGDLVLEKGQDKLQVTDSDAIHTLEDLKSFIEHQRAVNSIPFPVPQALDQWQVKIIDDGPMRIFVWNDRQDPKQKLIFYLHGGSYFKQPKDRYFNGLNEWARELGAKIVMPLYPKGPQYSYRASQDRLVKLYLKLLESLEDAKQVSLIGDSSGGGLSMGLADRLAQKGIDQPKDIVLISPWLDIATDNPDIADYQGLDPDLRQWVLQEYGKIWAGGPDNRTNPMVSPLYSQELYRMGKLTIIVGDQEIFYPDNLLLHDKLSQLGIDHNFIVGLGLHHIFAMKETDQGFAMRRQIAGIIEED